MLTKLTISNFKRFGEKVEIDLSKVVVFVGPNNSGKTTALQALALWDFGLKKWLSKRGEKPGSGETPGVTINYRDLTFLPIPTAKELWNDLHVRRVNKSSGRQSMSNLLITIGVSGIDNGREWSCELQFDYANQESFYCKPISSSEGVPRLLKFSFLPPMSGLAAVEPKWESGRVNVLIGEGQTAQVLRNLCYEIFSREDKSGWNDLNSAIKEFFPVALCEPRSIIERGEITMRYVENATEFDLTSSGRGLQQILLLLCQIYRNPNSVLLFDEPDAHLEILRQKQAYSKLSSIAQKHGSQIVIASHSEVILNEAASQDTVVAFIGTPHTLHGRSSQLLKSLSEIGWQDYLLAERNGWVLYMEDYTDIAILKAFAEQLNHPVAEILETVFSKAVSTNVPNKARDHFFGLREAHPTLRGIAIFDRLSKQLHEDSPLIELEWRRREIENYLCYPETLLNYATSAMEDDLFGRAESKVRQGIMEDEIRKTSEALRRLRRIEPWSADCKVTEDFLEPLFESYFLRLNLPILLRKGGYSKLVSYVPVEAIDSEIIEKLDRILLVANPSFNQ